MSKKINTRRITELALGLALAGTIVISLVLIANKAAPADTDTSAGVSYLEEAGKNDPHELDGVVSEREREQEERRLAEERKRIEEEQRRLEEERQRRVGNDDTQENAYCRNDFLSA